MPRLCLTWCGYDAAGHPVSESVWFANDGALLTTLTMGLELGSTTLTLTEDARHFPPGIVPFAAGTLGWRNRIVPENDPC